MRSNSHLLKQQYRQLIFDNKDQILARYSETLSASSICQEFGIGRKALERFLKAEGVYCGFNNREANKKRAQRIKKTIQERYGVVNIGQLASQRNALKARNSIEFNTPQFVTDFNEYRLNVNLHTKRSIRLLLPGKYCFYTGIMFSDEDGAVNPNCPRKRTVDHKISIFEGFINNIPAETIGSISNIAYCIKHVNTLKGNMPAEIFVAYYAPLIRERYLNEGFICN